ncbi:MAG: hypothetical protein CM1200mP6_04460 [Anaerolineaceae bacterium]|nr:MAG: hypothetical protein CM1200mP6_04460 [Anaerolineaceae bacterium]
MLLNFNNVSFGYTSDNSVLKNVSFSASPGQTIALVGQTGSGKSILGQVEKTEFMMFKVVVSSLMV